MSDHAMEFTFENENVRAKLVCNAPEDASCRWVSSCDCETYVGPYKDEQGWYHEFIEFIEGDENTPDVEREVKHRHDLSAGDECAYQAWINADSPMECGPATKVEVATLPVDLTWEGDFYAWAPAEAKA